MHSLFYREKAYKELGFLINSFKHGAPSHGEIALLKNNAGRFLET